MKGKYHIVVQNNRLRYELDIRRNITIIRGDSATGKTRLIALLEQASAFGDGSGVEVHCERPVRTLGGKAIKDILNHPEDFIESREYFSWERYFAELLVEYTQDSYLKYNKSRLNEAYLNDREEQAILSVMKGVNWQMNRPNS